MSGPAIVKEIDLADSGVESKSFFVAKDLTKSQEAKLMSSLKDFKNVFLLGLIMT